MRLFGKPLHLIIGKVIFLFFCLLVLFGMGWFVRQTYIYYDAIKSGKTNPLLERKLESTVSRLVANTNVEPGDLARLQDTETAHLGTKGAKLTIVEFLDFDCPFCRASFSPVREIVQKYQDQIYFIVRDFPVQDIHPRALPAALAARCAAAQDKFWPYHDKLYIDQQSREDEDFKRFAREVGLDEAAFHRCYTTQEHAKAIERDVQDALRAGVQGTPTFFFNGIKIQGALDAEILDLLIKQFLNTQL